jgi:STE24 endopeptidase
VRASRLGWPLALLAALVATEAAVLVLRPRGGVLKPAPVSATGYFSAHDVDRARAYSRPQLALFAAQLVAEGALLVVLVRRPPRRLRGPFRRPLLAGAATGAALAVALTAVTLPLSAVAEQRARDYGLSTQDWGGWAGDTAKGLGVELVLAAGGGALALALVRRFPRRWWIPAAAGSVALGAAFLVAGPLVIDPLFNRFTPLPAGQTRSDVVELARQAGVKVDRVLEMDASRQTSAANAYVTGLGAAKRVVLYDNLLKRFTRDEVRLVVAHELGHVHYRDVPRGLIFLALVAPFGTLAIQRLSWRLSPERGTPASLPALALSLALVSMPMTWLSNSLSRRVEARADSFALLETGETKPFIEFEQRIARTNLSDPDPPAWLTYLLGTHPPSVERIGLAVAYERGAR